MDLRPLNPYYGATQAAATIAGVVNVTVPSIAKQVLLENVGTVLAFVRVKPNGSAVDASATDLPLPAGRGRVITKDGGDFGTQDGQTVVSVFSSGAGSTVYVTPCEGLGSQ